ncbi:sugar transferase [Fusobacterium varium]
MRHNRNMKIRIIYFFILFFIYRSIFVYLGLSINTAVYGIFILISFFYYLLDLLNFNNYQYKTKDFIYSSVINFCGFSIFYFFYKKIEFINAFLFYDLFQNILRYLLLICNKKVMNVGIIDSGDYTGKIADILEKNKQYNYVGYLNDEEKSKEKYLGKITDIEKIVKEENIESIIFTSRKQIINYSNMITNLKLQGIKIIDYISFLEKCEGKIDTEKIDDFWIVMSDGFVVLNNTLQKRIKRFFDIVVSISMLIGTMPLIIITYILVKMDIGIKNIFINPMKIIRNPAFFKQKRIGIRGNEFEIIKFRSMKIHDPTKFSKYASECDDRITPIGKFIRKTRLDELPQLINVLKGEMSFVGPRPEWNELGREYEKKIKNYKLRYAVQPGLTGWAQVMYSYGASIEDAEIKLEYDLYYIKHQDLVMDMIIFFKTCKTVIFGKGI